MDTSAQTGAQGTAHQQYRAQNIETLVNYYKSGFTDVRGRVGIELEHFVVHKDTKLPVRYSEPQGTVWLLNQLAEYYPKKVYEGDHLIGLSRSHGDITEGVSLEPAAQVELSAGPFTTLADTERSFNEFESHLTSAADEIGAEIARVAYQPKAIAKDTELIPKKRYDFMNKYLGGLSPWGPRMMRGTTSTQVSIDYSDTADCLRKLRLADALVPILSLICDNSPIFEGKRRPHKLMRTENWEKLDPGRSGITPGVMDPNYTLERMAEHVLDTVAITVPDGHGNVCYDDRTFGEVYADRPMTKEEAVHAVSMLFNDVRLKTYIEIRLADAMPIPYVLAYAALIKGELYEDRSLDALDTLFDGVTEDDIVEAKHVLERDGYQATVYGQDVSKLADRLIEIAYDGLSEDERYYLDPLAKLVEKRTTLADIWEQEHAQ